MNHTLLPDNSEVLQQTVQQFLASPLHQFRLHQWSASYHPVLKLLRQPFVSFASAAVCSLQSAENATLEQQIYRKHHTHQSSFWQPHSSYTRISYYEKQYQIFLLSYFVLLWEAEVFCFCDLCGYLDELVGHKHCLHHYSLHYLQAVKKHVVLQMKSNKFALLSELNIQFIKPTFQSHKFTFLILYFATVKTNIT